MSYRLTLFTCADAVIMDQRTNRLSVINAYEDIASAMFPIFIQRMSVAVILGKDVSDRDTPNLTLKAGIGDSIFFDIRLECNFQGHFRTRCIADIAGFIIPSPGLLEFKLALDGTQIGAWDMRVEMVGQPSVQTTSNA